MPYISQEIRNMLSNLSCECVADKLGLNVNLHKTLCFMHDDHHPSLHFYGNNRQRWFCFVCNKGGDAIKLVMEYTGWNFYDSCIWLCKAFNIDIGNNTYIKKDPTLDIKKKLLYSNKHIEKPFISEVAKYIIDNNTLTARGKDFLFNERHLGRDIIDNLNIISLDNKNGIVEKLKRKFDIQTLENSGLITITNGNMYFRMFTPCLIFPYYDIEKKLVGLQSRYLGNNSDFPRFQFVSSQKTRVFNLPILKDISEFEDIYISEGVTDCLALLSSGRKAVAIPSATILPKFDLMELIHYRIHMYPDRDKAGERAFTELRRFFINMGTNIIKHTLPDDVNDFSEYYLKIK